MWLYAMQALRCMHAYAMAPHVLLLCRAYQHLDAQTMLGPRIPDPGPSSISWITDPLIIRSTIRHIRTSGPHSTSQCIAALSTHQDTAYAYALLRHGRVRCTLRAPSGCSAALHSVGSHTPEMSSSGYLTGHDPTHRDLMDPGSLDLEYLIIYVSTGYTSPPTYMPMHAWPHTTYVVLYRRTCGVYHIPHPTLSLSPLPGSRDLGPLWISWLSDPTSPDLVIPRILDPVSLHLTYPTSATSRNAALRVCCTTPMACTCMLLRCIPGSSCGLYVSP